MNIYVMSDIHGEGQLFHAMLKQIHFSDKDYLYIIGDVIDRGVDGIKLLLEIIETPNIQMILGNHEYMMLQYLSPDATEVDIRRWNKNGNAPTLDAYRKLEPEVRTKVLAFLRSCPVHTDLYVNNNLFFLVHGFPGKDIHDCVWNRPVLDAENPIPGTTLIVGHTPVPNLLYPSAEDEEIIADMTAKGTRSHILHANGFIDIDCGCSFEKPIKTLGCLRLNDMAEFYEYCTI